MSKFSESIQGKLSEKSSGGENGNIIYKGEIAIPSDFPLPPSDPAGVQIGWEYSVIQDVTDNDSTRTNTDQSFVKGDEIRWAGTEWIKVGPDALWRDNGTNYISTRNRGIEIPKNIRSHANTSTDTLTLGEGVAYAQWNMNGNTTDSSGNNRNGTPTDIVYVAGKIGQAAQFNGTSSLINCGNIANFGKNDSFSIHTWVKIPSVGTSPYGSLFSNLIWDSVRKGMSLAYDSSEHQLLCDFISTISPSNMMSQAYDLFIDDDVYHQLILTYDGSASITGLKIYLDNTLLIPDVQSNTLTDDFKADTNSFILGADKSNGLGYENYFAGEMDTFIIFNHVLTQDQINELWNGGAGTENLPGGYTINAFDNDPTMSSDSPIKVATQQATKALIDNKSIELIWDGSKPFSTFVTEKGIASLTSLRDVHLSGTGHTIDAVGSPYTNLKNIQFVGGSTIKTVTIADTVTMDSLPNLSYNISLISDSSNYVCVNPTNAIWILGMGCSFYVNSGKLGISQTTVSPHAITMYSSSFGAFNENSLDLGSTGSAIILISNSEGGTSLNPTTIYGSGTANLTVFCNADAILPTFGSFTNFSGLISISYLNSFPHGKLSELTEDQHLQYLNRNGSRPMTGKLNLGINPISLNDGSKEWTIGFNNFDKSLEIISGNISPPNATKRLKCDVNTGIWNVQTSNYEDNVSDPNDIPNQQWVVDHTGGSTYWQRINTELSPKNSGDSVKTDAFFEVEKNDFTPSQIRFKNTESEYWWGIENNAMKLINKHGTESRPIVINEYLPDGSLTLTNAGGGRSYFGLDTTIFALGEKVRIWSGSNDLFTMYDNGLMQSQVSNYDTLVSNDGDIINKKYFDTYAVVTNVTNTFTEHQIIEETAIAAATGLLMKATAGGGVYVRGDINNGSTSSGEMNISGGWIAFGRTGDLFTDNDSLRISTINRGIDKLKLTQQTVTTGTYNALDSSIYNHFDCDITGGPIIINGISGGVKGKVIFISCNDNGNNLTITNQSGSAIAGNKIQTGLDANIVADKGGGLALIHNGTEWRCGTIK